MAHKLYLSDKTISSWEKDRTLLSLNIIVMLSDLLDTTTTYLIYGDIKKLEVETEIKIPISKKQYEDLKLYF